MIKAAYAAYAGQYLGSRESTSRSALDLSHENINYRDSDSYGVVMAAAATVIKDRAGRSLNISAVAVISSHLGVVDMGDTLELIRRI